MAKRTAPQPETHTLLEHAVEALGGPAIVLDLDLRIVAATPSVEALLGAKATVGAPAAKLLCGQATTRPVAEALAEGRSIRAVIPRPLRDGGDFLLRVRTSPLLQNGERVGWLLLLDAGAEGTSATTPTLFHGIWTGDPAMKQVFHIIERAARSEARVLVRGATGTGKELVASAIHALSPRSDGPFRGINCAALPPELLASELFGHVRGAFTGAVRDSPGHFRLADRGTLFLDEVAEMPLHLQAMLLRVLETGTVIPVGGRDPVAVDVRIVAATHRGLRAEVAAGRFRADLMYRLRVVPIFLPSLAGRQGDIELLLERFIDEQNDKGGRKIERVAKGARDLLLAHDWPGNVRELRNVVEYAFVVGEGPVLVESDLPPEIGDPTALVETALGNAPPPLTAAERETTDEGKRILRALERASGSKDRAARMLGMSRTTLWRKLRALGLGADES